MESVVQTLVTQGIRISVRTTALPDSPEAKRGQFIFAYQISIRNESDETVQLVSRHWRITDAFGVKRVVEGPGVVGRQPVLKPNGEYRYTSGCAFPTPIGRMEGHYLFEREVDGVEFDVQIPTMVMIWPHCLN
jgi:ApaG protein